MSSNYLDTLIFRIFLAVSAILLGYVALFSEVHYEGSESLYHYFHSKALFSHPEVAVNHWGKPLFIALSSPFSLFGDKGVMIFNCIIMLLSAIVVFKFCKKIGIKYAFPVAIFTLFTPVYFKFSQSCLTEPLFGFVAIFGAYLVVIKKYNWSAIVISFLLFARSEGMIFIPIYAFVLVLKKQYKSIPLLGVGFLFYGMIGKFVGKDPLWYYYDYPYHASAVDIYGKGPFWNYFINQEHITGTPLSALLALSFIIVVSIILFKFKEVFQNNLSVFVFLVFFPACIYVFGHSYLWYAGKSASVGLYRIVGGVIPLLATIAMFGLAECSKLFNKNLVFRKIRVGLYILICFFVISFTFKNVSSVILVQPDAKEKLILKSINYIKTNKLFEKNDLYVFQAHYIAEFEGDHFDRINSRIKAGVGNRSHPEQELKSGDILVWDGVASPNEGGLPISILENNANFIPLVTFRPEQEFTVLGGGNYYIKIFQRK